MSQKYVSLSYHQRELASAIASRKRSLYSRYIANIIALALICYAINGVFFTSEFQTIVDALLIFGAVGCSVFCFIFAGFIGCVDYLDLEIDYHNNVIKSIKSL